VSDTLFGTVFVGAKERPGVHQRHCCQIHGCKYGYDDCPVYDRDVQQEFPCEQCQEDIAIWIAGYVMAPVPVGYWP
jgi:hypothetical protein